MSDINMLGSDVPAAASSDQSTADQAGPSSDNGAVLHRRGGLSGMVMVELRTLAGQMGIRNISGMRKNDLISAIKERQGTPRIQRLAAAEQLPLDRVDPQTGARADAPTARADTPTARADTPTARADAPTARADTPTMAPAQGQAAAPPVGEPMAAPRAEQQVAPVADPVRVEPLIP
ncbi:MAG: Rho termination factor N-terminal domain-containing protein, partial [Pseudonocardiaceae bacterium]